MNVITQVLPHAFIWVPGLVLWAIIGNGFWNAMRSHATTPDELAFIATVEGGRPLLRILRWTWVMVWPIWAILPPVLNFIGESATRLAKQKGNKGRLPY